MNVKFDADRPGTKPQILHSEPSENIRFKHEAFAIEESPRVTFKRDMKNCDSNVTLKR